ncbi:MAG TPA: hypothetical protein VE571_01390 [Solirubrobacteraceae bacterium]|jgi:hypothetical protein|nr:hypothetical protein [Solirubrobacteraceae bacterium]
MSLGALREALLDHGGTLADSIATAPPSDLSGGVNPGSGPGVGAPKLAASGPRSAGQEREYELLVEMILEGSLLHYGTPRLVRCDDRDLALLLGDQLYALGLARLAELGDLEAVAELADLISLLAQAQAASDDRLAEAIWHAGAAAIGWGQTVEHAAAKALARAGDRAAADALTSASEAVIARCGEGHKGGVT